VDVVISGSSGLVGSVLVAALTEAGHRPIRLVRRTLKPGHDEIRWQPDLGEIDAASLEGVDAVIHLAGAGIGDKRWNEVYKQLLVSSRTEPTKLLASTLAALDQQPQVFLSASAIGYYGDRAGETLTETSAPGTGFLTDLVLLWEAAAQPAVDAGIRTVALRTGIVLSRNGGALAKMLPLFRMGLGGRFGSGRQYQSWISIDDVVGAMIHLANADVSGPANLTAPNPVPNTEFTSTLASVLRRPAFVPVPAFGPKLLLGAEMAQALLFEDQRILPEVLTDSGYEFAHPRLEAALRSVLDKPA